MAPRCCSACFTRVKTAIERVFFAYGKLVGTHPMPFILMPIVILGGLGAGLVTLEPETKLETIYYPKDSQALDDRQYVRDTFPDLSNVSYSPFSLSDTDNAASIIFKLGEGQSSSGSSIFDDAVMKEIQGVVSAVEGITDDSGSAFKDLCAMSKGVCVVNGRYALDAAFRTQVANRAVSYPIHGDLDLQNAIAGTTLSQGGKLLTASVLKVSFKLSRKADDWKSKFLEFASQLDLATVEVAYETPESLSQELDKSTKGDVVFFSLTITIICCYASVVSAGGNPVSTRAVLALAGILAAGLGILGSMGLLCLCGVSFVNIVGVIPFLVIGIGVDDMFLMMSSWSETLAPGQSLQDVPEMVGRTVASAGIGITITSLTDFLAFVIGTTSVFRSVTDFSLYAGIAVLFCYLANLSMFTGCLVLHGRRVFSWRHTLTCLATRPRQQLQEEGKSKCLALLCGGHPPRKERDDESVCEMLPSRFLPKLFSHWAVSVVVIVLFLGYLAVSIYGIVHLQEGLVLQDLVLDSSYYRRFLTLSDQHFPIRIPLGFIVQEPVDYASSAGNSLLKLLQTARQDSAVDDSFERCWLTSYQGSAGYNAAAFMVGLPAFLTNRPDFAADVVMDAGQTQVVASRCFVYSKPNTDQYDNARLMARMRDVAEDSPLEAAVYHWSFVALEQFLAVLPATLQLVGSAVAVMTVVTFLFLPHPLMVGLVLLTILMILTGIFGFLHFWGLSLSSITMIHLIMSVGFSVDFSAHVCTAYLLSPAATRRERAADAIRHAAGPILNGAISTLLGVLLLLFSSSFIFQSFFKVMFVVIVFGFLHAVFFLPALLSLLGPQNLAVRDKDVGGSRGGDGDGGGNSHTPATPSFGTPEKFAPFQTTCTTGAVGEEGGGGGGRCRDKAAMHVYATASALSPSLHPQSYRMNAYSSGTALMNEGRRTPPSLPDHALLNRLPLRTPASHHPHHSQPYHHNHLHHHLNEPFPGHPENQREVLHCNPSFCGFSDRDDWDWDFSEGYPPIRRARV